MDAERREAGKRLAVLNGSESVKMESKRPPAGAPPADLVHGERLLWKMADVKGVFTRRLVTGYLITNFRCFVWDAEKDSVRASVPISRCEIEVSSVRVGVRTRRGGSFMPTMQQGEQAGPNLQAPQGTSVTMGELTFRVDGEVIMVFREVSEPERVKQLIDGLKALWKVPADPRVEEVVRAASG